ncbi:hypothetical protein EV361DRAFT_954240 [Lentinula raphanica]|nr:hypothetical protein EV361DRAFT_954240 [Lentinula raphanica]
MAPERARGASRRRTNQQKYSPRPSRPTMTLRSATKKSQDVTATSKPTTAISIPTPVATATATGESNISPVSPSSVDLLSHDLPLDARTLSDLAARAAVVTSEGSSSLSEAHPSIDVSNPTPHTTTTNTHMHDLPSKPLIPVELPDTDPSIKRLETFFASTTQLFDKQEASINTTNEYIELVTQLCIDYKEILASKQVIERIDHSSEDDQERAISIGSLREIFATANTVEELYILSEGVTDSSRLMDLRYDTNDPARRLLPSLKVFQASDLSDAQDPQSNISHFVNFVHSRWSPDTKSNRAARLRTVDYLQCDLASTTNDQLQLYYDGGLKFKLFSRLPFFRIASHLTIHP